MINNKQNGATMIEVLVTIIIIAIGLLGIAGMQMISLKNANQSEARYQAVALTYEMLERMRSNMTGVEAGNYNSVSVDGTESDVSCDDSVCSASQMANKDKYYWGQQLLASKLPSAKGTISHASGSYTISISWIEQNTGGGIGAEVTQASPNTIDRKYQLTVQL